VHHPARRQLQVLGVLDHRQVEVAGVEQGATHQLGVRHRLAVVGDRNRAGGHHVADLGQLLAAQALADRAHRVDPGEAVARRASLTMCSVTERLSLTGTVLAMQATAVKPPAAAARVPVRMVSLYSWPGSRRCTWMSISPGATTSPLASSTSASAAAIPASDLGADLGDAAVGAISTSSSASSSCGSGRPPGRRGSGAA
jgi:hypothetical protein